MRQFPEPLLLILAPLALVVAAACGGADDASSGAAATQQAEEQQAEACMEQPDPSACIENLNATSVAGQPTPAPPDPRIRQIFLANDVVRTLIGDSEERRDYWLIIDQLTSPADGDGEGMVTVIFDQPVSYSGEVPTRSDPCKGHGDEGRVDPDDPCRDEPIVYGTEHLEFAGVPVVHVWVHTGRGEVVWLFPDATPPDIVADMIDWAEETQY